MVADGDALVIAKKSADVVISKDELPKWKDKKKARELASSFDFMIVQTNLMQPLATTLGTILGPKGKMPNPAHVIPVVSNIEPVIKKARNSVRVRIKDAPVIHTIVGSDDMDDEKLADNIEAVMAFTTKKLLKGRNNIKNVILKSTMSPVVKLYV